jgi:hypothetical protein
MRKKGARLAFIACNRTIVSRQRIFSGQTHGFSAVQTVV